MAGIVFPQSAFLDVQGRVAREWVSWLQNPQLLTINLQTAIGISSGGTGIVTVPTNGQLLIGNGTGYALGTLGAGTGITVTYGPGTISAAISNTGVTPTTYGTAGRSAVVTVNLQGQITGASDTPIAITTSQVSGLGSMSTQSAATVAITGGTVTGAAVDNTPIGATTQSTGRFTTLRSGAFGANGALAQTAVASGAAAPAGGVGTAAGGYDTAAHRDALIALVNIMQSALIANGIMT